MRELPNSASKKPEWSLNTTAVPFTTHIKCNVSGEQMRLVVTTDMKTAFPHLNYCGIQNVCQLLHQQSAVTFTCVWFQHMAWSTCRLLLCQDNRGLMDSTNSRCLARQMWKRSGHLADLLSLLFTNLQKSRQLPIKKKKKRVLCSMAWDSTHIRDTNSHRRSHEISVASQCHFIKRNASQQSCRSVWKMEGKRKVEIESQHQYTAVWIMGSVAVF